MQDFQEFYRQLFAPLIETVGPIDRDMLFAVFGFGLGGPLNFRTIGANDPHQLTTYVSCELAVREWQLPSSLGRYELLCTCDSEQWVRSILSAIGRASGQMVFGPRHTIDLGPLAQPTDSLQGVLFETAVATEIDKKPFGILRVIGITRPELKYKIEHGSEALLDLLKSAHIYPNTLVGRNSVV